MVEYNCSSGNVGEARVIYIDTSESVRAPI